MIIFGLDVVLWIMFLEVVALLGCYIAVLSLCNTVEGKEVKKRMVLAKKVILGAALTLFFHILIAGFASQYFDETMLFSIIVSVFFGVGLLIRKNIGMLFRIYGYVVTIVCMVILSGEIYGDYSYYTIESVWIMLLCLGAFVLEFVKKKTIQWIGLGALVVHFIVALIFSVSGGMDVFWIYMMMGLPVVLVIQNNVIKLHEAAEKAPAVATETAVSWADASTKKSAPAAKVQRDSAGELCMETGARKPAVLMKKMPMEIFLYIITCGVWELVWVYQVSKYLNEATGEQERNPAGCVWLSLLPFYRAYWAYRQALRIETLLEKRGEKTESLAIVAFMAALLCPLLAFVAIQNKIKALLDEK